MIKLFLKIFSQRRGRLRAGRGWGRRGGRRARRRDHPAREGEDVVGVGARRGGARVGRAVAPHHWPGPARPQAFARRGGARGQRAVRAGLARRGAARSSPPTALTAPTRLGPVRPRGEIPRQVLPVLHREREASARAGVHQVARSAVLVAALVERSGSGARLPRAALHYCLLHAEVLQFAS